MIDDNEPANRPKPNIEVMFSPFQACFPWSGRSRPARPGFSFILLVALLLLCPGVIPSAYALNTTSTGTDLSSLEHRLFVEEYPNQSTDQRLARLEKFVFGTTRTGSDSNRLTSLLLAVPDLSQTADSNEPSPPGPASNINDTRQEEPLANNPVASQSDLSSIDYYPTVTALEDKILGHDDRTAPLSNQLSALETKAFGEPDDSGKDFATRVDRLKNYLAKKYGNDDYLSSPDPVINARSNVPVASLNLTSQITLLEKTVFARTYTRDGIISRLDRLEKAVYPQEPVQSFSSGPARIQRLMTTLMPQDVAQSAAYSGTSGAKFSDKRDSSKKHHFWHNVGSVLGKAGIVAASALGSSMTAGMGGYGYPGYGSGMMFGGPGGMY